MKEMKEGCLGVEIGPGIVLSVFAITVRKSEKKKIMKLKMGMKMENEAS